MESFKRYDCQGEQRNILKLKRDTILKVYLIFKDVKYQSTLYTRVMI